jgi:ribosomal protein L11 methyltransferase
VPTAEAELARAWLLERFPDGFEERGEEGRDRVELAVYTDDAGARSVGAAFLDARVDEVPSGWEERWKDFHRPVRAGGLWIGPPWTPVPAVEVSVVVDPGRAFGTGAHPTTRACIELLAGVERGSLLDAGCGSGVVAVAAHRLGFAPVWAVDSDPVAVAVAAETTRSNAAEVAVRRLDVLLDELPETDAVVANIELAVVEQLLPRTSARVAVTSGYLAPETPRAQGWSIVERLELEGWAADMLARGH